LFLLSDFLLLNVAPYLSLVHVYGTIYGLSTLTTGDYSRPIRGLSPKTATVAVFGDKLLPKSATIVSSVDRPLGYFGTRTFVTLQCCANTALHVSATPRRAATLKRAVRDRQQP